MSARSSASQNVDVDRVPANNISKSRSGPTGTSVQHFVRRVIHVASTSTTAPCVDKSLSEFRRQCQINQGELAKVHIRFGKSRRKPARAKSQVELACEEVLISETLCIPCLVKDGAISSGTTS